jgi:hypothetical protein
MKRLVVPLALAALLGGCAVYGPPPAGYAAYPYSPEPVYAAPVYAAPAPVYAPPISFSFGFLSGGNGGGHWHHR